jgi:hypothetical protein
MENRFSLASFAIAGAMILALCVLSRDEQIGTFSIGRSYTIDVYAEGDFHYEPPGYIYFELRQWGQIRVPRRRFMGIGPERKPRDKFRLVTTSDEEVAALVLNDEVQMIHEFSSGYTWPGPYTNVTEPQWQIAESLLQQLRSAHPEVRCTRQDWYRKELDRRKAK